MKMGVSLEPLSIAKMKKKGEGYIEDLAPFFHSWM